jgi:methionyl-tRNA formyltransferase
MLRIVFMGSPDFAVPALRAVLEHHRVELVVTQTDKRAGRGKRVVSPPVKLLAEEAGIPVIQPKSAKKNPELVDRLKASGADIGVVVAYGKILPLEVLEAFPRGCVNVHGSLLPAYRGAAPIQWAIINGETETGITIMRLDEGMDTGPMILKRAIPISADDTAGTLFERLAPLGAEMLLEALAKIEDGTAVFEPQDDNLASKAPMMKKERGRVDWSQPAAMVVNLVRGVDPWPGAFTELAGDPLKLFAAIRAEGEGPAGKASGVPGEVIGVDERGLWIACGEGACVVGEVQAAGKKRMTARAFASGRALPPGTVLGE